MSSSGEEENKGGIIQFSGSRLRTDRCSAVPLTEFLSDIRRLESITTPSFSKQQPQQEQQKQKQQPSQHGRRPFQKRLSNNENSIHNIVAEMIEREAAVAAAAKEEAQAAARREAATAMKAADEAKRLASKEAAVAAAARAQFLNEEAKDKVGIKSADEDAETGKEKTLVDKKKEKTKKNSFLGGISWSSYWRNNSALARRDSPPELLTVSDALNLVSERSKASPSPTNCQLEEDVATAFCIQRMRENSLQNDETKMKTAATLGQPMEEARWMGEEKGESSEEGEASRKEAAESGEGGVGSSRCHPTDGPTRGHSRREKANSTDGPTQRHKRRGEADSADGPTRRYERRGEAK